MFELIMCYPRSLFGGTECGDAIECNLSIIILFFSFFETLLILFSFLLFFLCTPCHKYLISFVVCFLRFVFLAKTMPESSLDRCKYPLFIFILRLFGRQPRFNPVRWLKESVETQRSCKGRRKMVLAEEDCWGVGWCNWDRMRWYQCRGRHE